MAFDELEEDELPFGLSVVFREIIAYFLSVGLVSLKQSQMVSPMIIAAINPPMAPATAPWIASCFAPYDSQ